MLPEHTPRPTPKALTPTVNRTFAPTGTKILARCIADDSTCRLAKRIQARQGFFTAFLVNHLPGEVAWMWA